MKLRYFICLAIFCVAGCRSTTKTPPSPSEQPSSGSPEASPQEAPTSAAASAPTTQPTSGPVCVDATCGIGPGGFKRVRTLGTSGTGPGQLQNPIGIVLSASHIYVSDTGNNRVQQLTLDGAFVREWADLARPMHLSLTQDDSVGVPLYLDDTILVLGADGKEQSRFGGEWLDAPGSAVRTPAGWWIADFYNHQVHRTSPKGVLELTVGKKGHGDGEFTYPTDIAIGPNNTVWVADAYGHRLQALDGSGKFVRALGSQGSGPGEFNIPIGIDVGVDGRIYVADSGNNRIQVFDSDGEIEAIVGAQELDRPQDIVVVGNLLYVVDHGHQQIVVYDKAP